MTYGSFTIDAAAQLNNQASMMNRNINIKGEDPNAIPDYQASTPETFQEQLYELTAAYLQLKDALVETDANTASDAAKNVIQSLEKVNKTLLQGDVQLYWVEQLTALQTHSQKITTATTIETQRQQFEFVSIAMIRTITAFGTSEETLYIQHCPMAFDTSLEK